jgi:hypothetical protein
VGELEQHIAMLRNEKDQADKRIAGEAAKGKALIAEFVMLMRRHKVPKETIYRKTFYRGGYCSSDRIGEGWMLDLHPDERSCSYHYVIPGKGIAYCRDSSLDGETIKVLAPQYEIDDSDWAWSRWAYQAQTLASTAQGLIEGVS